MGQDNFKTFISLLSPSKLVEYLKGLAQQVSSLTAELSAQKEKVRELEDELRRLKGEKPKPNFDKDQKKPKDRSNPDMGEKPTRKGSGEGKGRGKNKKKKKIVVTRREKANVGPNEIDGTFIPVGTRKVVIQDLKIELDNVEFTIERFYSSENKKVVEGRIPEAYRGNEFGPIVRTLVPVLGFQGQMTIDRIKDVLNGFGIHISKGQVCNILNSDNHGLGEEMKAARDTAVEELGYQHIDDTGAKIAGKNGYTFVTCNELFMQLQTGYSKGRFSTLLALSGCHEPLFKFTEKGLGWVLKSNKSEDLIKKYEELIGQKVYTADEFKKLFDPGGVFEESGFHKKERILVSCLYGAFYDEELGPIGNTLISDDAPNFRDIYESEQLCWPHEVRHYKLLKASEEYASNQIEQTIRLLKGIYRLLKRFRETGKKEIRDFILEDFNKLLEPSELDELDGQKILTFNKQYRLLESVLFEEKKIPLDNNDAERELRRRVIKRKISFHNMSMAGVRAWDLKLSLYGTTRKLGIRFWDFMCDRVCERREIPPLSEIIQEMAKSTQFSTTF